MISGQGTPCFRYCKLLQARLQGRSQFALDAPVQARLVLLQKHLLGEELGKCSLTHMGSIGRACTLLGS
ncbi:hypothetical protein WJX77_000258 [Trebouxia sp. C0004]